MAKVARAAQVRLPPILWVVLVAAVILYGSLYPWRFETGSSQASPLAVLLHSRVHLWNRWAFRDAAINLALYVPLGLTAYLTLARRLPRWAALAAAVVLGLALSAGVEILQVYVPGRTTSLSDVVFNVAGTAAGAGAALVFQGALERRFQRYGAADLFLLAFWAGYQLYPLFPVFGRTKLRYAFWAMANTNSLSGVEVWATAAEWFAAALVLESLWGRLRGVWLLAAMACVPLRLFIVDRWLTLSEVLGAALALLLWCGLPERVRLRAALGMLASAILLRELEPFHFSADHSAFDWIPFRAALGSEPHNAALSMSRKTFEYGASVWLLRARGISYLRGGLAVTASLAILEAVQCMLPGRLAEITDPLVASIMACLLWLLSDSRSPRGLG